MTEQELVDRLAQHRTLGKATRPELEWLVAHGTVREIQAGEILSHKGEQVEGLFIVLSGREPLTLETSVPGIFAAGDLRAGAMNRVASAVGEGSMVVRLAHEYLALT